MTERPPAAFSLGAPGHLEAQFRAAGFRDVAAELVGTQFRARSAAEMVADTKARLGPLQEEMARLSETERDQVWAEMEREFKRFEGTDGCVVPGEVHVVVGTK